VRRRDRKARRTLAHLVLRSQGLFLRRSVALLRLLLLLGTLRLALLALLLTLLRGGKASLTATSHNATEKTIAGGDRWRLLGGSSMLRRAGDTRLEAVLSSRINLMSQTSNLFFVSMIERLIDIRIG
jgi:hypothetical protein